eukprot:3085538-Rhodomonas_salina.1
MPVVREYDAERWRMEGVVFKIRFDFDLSRQLAGVAADHDLIRDQYAVSVPGTAQGLRSPDRYATSVLGIAQRTCRPLEQMRSQCQAPPSARVGT